MSKTREAAEGFRQLRLTQVNKIRHIVPEYVADLTLLRPFDAATNRTAVFVAHLSDRPVKWPIPYEEWVAPRGYRPTYDSQLENVVKKATKRVLAAMPMIADHVGSPWLTAPKQTLFALSKIAGGGSDLRAYAGICTWMNGVFWLKDVVFRSGGKAQISNWHDVGKIKVEEITTVVEDDLVFPLLRGRDLKRWLCKLSPYPGHPRPDDSNRDSRTHDEDALSRTLTYLSNFQKKLEKRPGYVKYLDSDCDPYWTVFNVSTYSFAAARVAFKELTDFFQCAVIDGTEKPAIADTKLRFIEVIRLTKPTSWPGC